MKVTIPKRFQQAYKKIRKLQQNKEYVGAIIFAERQKFCSNQLLR